MTFDLWFNGVVRKHYSNAKDFSDKEKFPLPCVYRWIRGACLPRPIQISLICKIVAQKEFQEYLDKEKGEPIVYDYVYSNICMEVMTLLERPAPKAVKNEKP